MSTGDLPDLKQCTCTGELSFFFINHQLKFHPTPQTWKCNFACQEMCNNIKSSSTPLFEPQTFHWHTTIEITSQC